MTNTSTDQPHPPTPGPAPDRTPDWIQGRFQGWVKDGPTPWALIQAGAEYAGIHHRIHHGPYTDTDAENVLRDALETLAPMRTPYWHGDDAVTIHLLGSLDLQIQARLPAAVADARAQGYTWADIGAQLAITPTVARHRYGHPTRFNDSPPPRRHPN